MSATTAARPYYVGKSAITGVGYTAFSDATPRSVLAHALTASRAAIADCGLTASAIDGVCSYGLFNDSVTSQAIATGLALDDLSYTLDLNNGGSQPCFAVLNAAMAIASGMATNVLVYRSLNGRSGTKVGSARFDAPSSQFRYPIGLTAYPQYIAMWARRYMLETGATELDLAAVVMRQREYAELNPRAMRRKTMTIEEYLSREFVVEPFRTVDCTVEVDGAVALVVSAVDRARDQAVPPAIIDGGAWVTGRGAGLDVADLHTWVDFTRNCQHRLAPRLWASAGRQSGEVDFAEIYDCFSPAVLYGLEALGFVGRGEAGAFVREGHTALDGSLPVNTHGGLLNEGYVHGLNTVTEAALQIQGRGGERQIARAESCAVTSGVLVDGSALILRRDS